MSFSVHHLELNASVRGASSFKLRGEQRPKLAQETLSQLVTRETLAKMNMCKGVRLLSSAMSGWKGEAISGQDWDSEFGPLHASECQISIVAIVVPVESADRRYLN